MTARDTAKPARCAWAGDDPLYQHYHDTEWGVPHADDQRLFEKLVLEGFQAGLSWITILRKRENFRRAFHGFDAKKIARYTERDVARLMADEGIIRNRLKIEATISNAEAYLALKTQGTLAGFLWAALGKREPLSVRRAMGDIPPVTDEAAKLSKALKKAGFRFVGPTSMYAFMQSTGMVNDHLVGCPRHAACAKLQRAFVPPVV
ncbi:MAG: DNA-3-methyladenine glycosylase I [Hyphomicrobium sp.]|uniref:DNA-3-methyladenine glycosylase I n=1 Tax=Hyphomicrobium sp. TaxID=82 RepID=UPI003D128E45